MDRQYTPAGPAPPGITPNFTNPETLGPNLVASNVVLLIISTIIIALRILSRTVLTEWRLGWDDYTMLLAYIGTVIFSAFMITTTTYGLGTHIWDVPLSTYSPHYLWWMMATFAACPASYYFVKLSVLFFYLRVFALKPRYRYIIYGLFVYCTIYYGVAFATIIGLCNLKNKTWDITVSMNCFAYGELTFAIGGLDLVADAIILAFPVPMVWRLKISWAQRAYLLFIFLAGIAASAACAIRIAFAVQAKGTTDATYAQYRVATLFCLEHYLALIAACMPTLGPFFRWLRPSKWRHDTLRSLRDPEQQRDWQNGIRKPSTLTDDSLMHGSVIMKDPESRDSQHPWISSKGLGGSAIQATKSAVYGAEVREERVDEVDVEVGEGKHTLRTTIEGECFRHQKRPCERRGNLVVH